MLLLFSFFDLKAQQGNKANTGTNKANEITISNGNTNREKVDSIFTGQIMI